jgi:hypothetical protein
MHNVQISHSPKTIGGIAAGFMAAQLLSAPFAHAEIDWRDRGSNIRVYRGSLTSATAGEHPDLFFSSHRVAEDAGEMGLIKFYSALLSDQQRLGEEFERVLFDNLWDLYAR